jgi:hypothetical protein
MLKRKRFAIEVFGFCSLPLYGWLWLVVAGYGWFCHTEFLWVLSVPAGHRGSSSATVGHCYGRLFELEEDVNDGFGK